MVMAYDRHITLSVLHNTGRREGMGRGGEVAELEKGHMIRLWSWVGLVLSFELKHSNTVLYQTK